MSINNIQYLILFYYTTFFFQITIITKSDHTSVNLYGIYSGPTKLAELLQQGQVDFFVQREKNRLGFRES